MLQLLDDGRLTDGQGRTVDFKNTVVIMTSNLGNELWVGSNGTSDVQRSTLNGVLKAHFRPEFLNRIDEIVVFHSLEKDHLKQIVDIQLEHVEKLLHSRGFSLEVTPGARLYLADAGYDPDYGARPLKRAIQRQLQDPLALEVLSGNLKVGELIRVDVGADVLKFTSIA